MIKKLILTGIILLFSISIFAGTKVVIKTNYGSIHIELYNQQAPVTVKNFLRYVDKKLYNGTIFHRVIDKFMIPVQEKMAEFIQGPPEEAAEKLTGILKERGLV